jgi:hypothetical protein
LPEDIVSTLPKIRTLCAAFDNCRETTTYGNPTFKRGPRNFLVLDRYKGRSCLWLLVDPALRDDLLAVDGWFPSPYDPRKIALCCHLDRLDWTSAAHLIKASYHLAQR